MSSVDPVLRRYVVASTSLCLIVCLHQATAVCLLCLGVVWSPSPNPALLLAPSLLRMCSRGRITSRPHLCVTPLSRQISFSLLSVEIIAQLQLDMVPLSVLPGDLILECGDPSLEVYFVCSGELEVRLARADTPAAAICNGARLVSGLRVLQIPCHFTSTRPPPMYLPALVAAMLQLLTPDLFPVAKLFRHASFGEPEVLHGTVRQVSVRAVQDSFLFAMSGETLIATLNKFTGVWGRVPCGQTRHFSFRACVRRVCPCPAIILHETSPLSLSPTLPRSCACGCPCP